MVSKGSKIDFWIGANADEPLVYRVDMKGVRVNDFKWETNIQTEDQLFRFERSPNAQEVEEHFKRGN